MKENPKLYLAGCLTTDPQQQKSSNLVFVGLPDDSKSAYRKGTAKAPPLIRSAYDGDCHNSTTETGVDLFGRVADLGDLPAKGSWDETAQSYREFATELFKSGKIPFFAGGDHAVTIPIVAALAVLNEPVHFVQIDAHPDLYPDFDGDRYSNACVAARILEMEHVASVTQIGIRTLNPPQKEFAEKYRDRLKIHYARELMGELPRLQGIPEGASVYLSLDIDGLDPAYAPGVSYPEPGGLTPRQVLNFLQKGHWKLIGMDVVEVNPELDVNNLTAILAGKIFHEAMGYALKHLK
ncbi:agmatinase [candidate division KSB1 bacterium]|nr:agmatinase [candidate division KSB1 bacterium]